MMKKYLAASFRFIIWLSLTFSLGACTSGKTSPADMLTQMHIAKSDDYKKRPGWDALVRLGDDDCQAYRSGGKSLIEWNGSTCDTKTIIDFVKKKPQNIPVFYAAYHEYGRYGIGEISHFNNSDATGEQAIKLMVNLSEVLGIPEKIDSIFADYERDYRRMGLDKIDEGDFKKILVTFAQKRDELASNYQKLHDENQKRYQAERSAQIKREKEASIASEREITPVLWQNPTPEHKIIVDALRTVKFTIRNDGVAYANGRRFMSVMGLEYLRNSLNMSMASCSDVGAYIGEKALNRACVRGIARNIVEWGKTAKDSAISDRAWNAAAMEGSINYNPIKYEILFSHWAGMARVYASRGY
ncbi:hypothetical protein [Pectobacterium sp. CHL-2024]|uniref:hypothetical protein n=1 Tax=Pectobacterium sp. CHL-2024 TaxID=3377079 RepID=UPI0038018487